MTFKAKIDTKNQDFLSFETDFARARWRDWCKKNDGKKVVINDVKNRPSEDLRGYYFGAVVPTVKSAVPSWSDLSDDDIHEILKKMFNYFDFYNPLTKRTERVGRSAMGPESNTARAMEFIEKIGVWLAEEFLIELPNPEEYKRAMDMPMLKHDETI